MITPARPLTDSFGDAMGKAISDMLICREMTAYISAHLKATAIITAVEGAGILSTAPGSPVGIVAPITFSQKGSTLWE